MSRDQDGRPDPDHPPVRLPDPDVVMRLSSYLVRSHRLMVQGEGKTIVDAVTAIASKLSLDDAESIRAELRDRGYML
jgi:hypothetical protein